MVTDADTLTPDYGDKIPADLRGQLHSVAGAILALLGIYGWANDSQLAAIGFAVIAALDLILVLYYTTDAWRKALYPLLYAVGGVLMVYGIMSQAEIGAILGVALAVLGTQTASTYTPKVVKVKGFPEAAAT